MLDAGYEITLVRLDGQAEIRLVGEFDLAAAPDLRRALLGRLSASIPVVVDMSDVTFVDSSALAVFIHAHRFATEKGTTFRLLNPTGQVTKVLEITGANGVLVVEAQPSAVARTDT